MCLQQVEASGMTESDKPHDQSEGTRESPHLEMLAGRGGETGTPEPSCWLAAACLGLLCAALFLGITSLGIHYHKSSLKSSLLSLELQASQEAKDLLRRENHALLTSQEAMRSRYSHAAAAREQAQRDALALAQSSVLLTHNNQQLQGELEKLRASATRLQSAHSQLQEEARSRLEAERSDRAAEACEQLQGERRELDESVERLQGAYALLSAARLRLLAENVRLSESGALLAQQQVAMERERARLRRTLTQLGHLPAVERQCPRKDPGTEERECEPCQRGWRVFSAHCYFFSTELRSWSSSRTHCLQQGGDLVVIDSIEEQEFLHRLTPQYRSPEQRYWIGLSDEEAEGVWVWVDGSTSMERRFWVGGFGGVDAYRDCASILKETSPMKNWREDVCTKTFRWICESKALVETA